MIARRMDGRIRLFMQTDHARLSGAMAAHWGNDAFRPPVAQERTAQGIAHHDDGWIAWEANPRVNRKTDRPFNFLEMPIDDILAIWYRGPKLTGEMDPYWGILDSCHGSFLLDMAANREGIAPAEKNRIRQYLADMETLRSRLAARLERTEPEAAPSLLAGVAHSYRLLQLTDNLSLRFCTAPLECGTLEDVPASGMDNLHTLKVLPRDAQALSLDPWPFGVQEILLPIPFYDLPNRRFTTYSDLRSEMILSGPSFIAFRLFSSQSA